MVLKGQYLERPTLIPLGKLVLEGLWHRGRRAPALLVLPPPPHEGSMDHVLASEIAWAVVRAGHPVMRFNYRGVGASQGKSEGDAQWLEDAQAALSVLEESAGGPGAVASLGGSAPVLAGLRQQGRILAACFVNPLGLRPTEADRSGLPSAVVLGPPPLPQGMGSWPGAIEPPSLPALGKAVAQWLGELTPHTQDH